MPERRIVEVGEKFGILEFVKELDTKKRKCSFKCICGNVIERSLYYVIQKRPKKCMCKVNRRVKVEYAEIDGERYKKCYICLEFKPISQFFKRTQSTDGFRNDCKICRNEKQKKRAIIRKRVDQAYLNKIRVSAKKYRQTKKYKTAIKLYREKLKTNISYKLIAHTRSRINYAIKTYDKCKRSLDLLGCSIEEYRNYLECKFKPGMTWENYGGPRKSMGWEIDHIIPCIKFDLSDPEQQKLCFHYTNTQPLWGYENARKGRSKYTIEEENNLEIMGDICTNDQA